MEVLFLHGPPACGKHTVGTLVSEELGLPLFHNHLAVDLASTLFNFGSKPFCQLRAEIWRMSFRLAAESGQSFLFTFNPENTVTALLLDDLKTIVERAGGVILYVEFTCSEPELLHRIGNESRSQFGKLTDRGLYSELKGKGVFDSPKLSKSWLRLDSGSLSASESAREIVNQYRAFTVGCTQKEEGA